MGSNMIGKKQELLDLVFLIGKKDGVPARRWRSDSALPFVEELQHGKTHFR